MSASKPRRPTRSTHGKVQSANNPPPIVCSRCGCPILDGQRISPLSSAKLVTWPSHPVLSKPLILRGTIPTDGSPGRTDPSLGDQLRQRAAMGGDKERAELAAFEELIAKWLA